MDFDGMAEVFKALGDPNRLRALHLLATGDANCCRSGAGVCACDVQAALGLSQPTVSHHMKVLTEAGLVSAEKRGKWTYYALSGPGLELAQTVLASLLDRLPEQQKEAV